MIKIGPSNSEIQKFRFRDKNLVYDIIGKMKNLGTKARFMHVCGTHQDTLVRYGLEALLESAGIKVIAGPGCPVCVTTPFEYEEAITLAEKNIIITAFGDTARSPGYNRSLLDMRSNGCDVRIVYGIKDAIDIAKKVRSQLVFMAVGFETTAPGTAVVLKEDLPENFAVLSCHRYVPPALMALLGLGELNIQGLIEPGHVSTIIGVEPYLKISEKYRIPQVIAGFEPLDLLVAIHMLLKQLQNNECKVENEYSRTVKYEGNIVAQKYLSDVFESCDVSWRGFPVIAESGMRLKKEFESFDARKKYEDILKHIDNSEVKEPKNCHCGEVLRGIFSPSECPLFSGACTPNTPVGPCMVSLEGSCNIEYRYSRRG